MLDAFKSRTVWMGIITIVLSAIAALAHLSPEKAQALTAAKPELIQLGVDLGTAISGVLAVYFRINPKAELGNQVNDTPK